MTGRLDGSVRMLRRITRAHEKGAAVPPALKEALETILVVDDNPTVLQVVAAILEAEHFRVLLARDGPSALKLAGETAETIHLLLSDVEMPGMSGPSLGEMLKESRPDMHVMFMSAGADCNLLVLNYGWAYIQKPFVAVKLVQMINNVLAYDESISTGRS